MGAVPRLVLISLSSPLSSYVCRPFKSVMHGWCTVRPVVAFPATEFHHALVGCAKLYFLVTDTFRHEHKLLVGSDLTRNRAHGLLVPCSYCYTIKAKNVLEIVCLVALLLILRTVCTCIQVFNHCA